MDHKDESSCGCVSSINLLYGVPPVNKASVTVALSGIPVVLMYSFLKLTKVPRFVLDSVFRS